MFVVGVEFVVGYLEEYGEIFVRKVAFHEGA